MYRSGVVYIYIYYIIYLYIYRQIRVLIRKTLPRFQHIAKLNNAAVWYNQLEYTWSSVEDLDMALLLQKEEDTLIFRSVRRRIFNPRGWMLKSRAFRAELKPLHIGVYVCVPVITCSLQVGESFIPLGCEGTEQLGEPCGDYGFGIRGIRACGKPWRLWVLRYRSRT